MPVPWKGATWNYRIHTTGLSAISAMEWGGCPQGEAGLGSRSEELNLILVCRIYQAARHIGVKRKYDKLPSTSAYVLIMYIE